MELPPLAPQFVQIVEGGLSQSFPLPGVEGQRGCSLPWHLRLVWMDTPPVKVENVPTPPMQRQGVEGRMEYLYLQVLFGDTNVRTPVFLDRLSDVQLPDRMLPAIAHGIP